ncbi:hypothetical protein Q1695_015764 [Nippostrongylus brasiliensis]|nr:hypothetical protein Q1695_015764 [Nippostrongylus brasiliensis]
MAYAYLLVVLLLVQSICSENITTSSNETVDEQLFDEMHEAFGDFFGVLTEFMEKNHTDINDTSTTTD